jgi:hypothetical protein
MKPNKQFTAYIGLFKLIVNHCVIVSAISNIKYNWSDILGNVMRAQSTIVAYLSKFVEFKCLLNATRDLETLDVDKF